MEQSKIISIDVDISLKETNVRTVDAVLFSRDVNAPKMRFNITKDGEEISDSTSVSLLLTASNYMGILRDGLNIKLNGTVTGGEVTFVLPNDILAYEGIVRADVYIYWANGSNDGTQPILFSVKRSALDSTASTMSVVYVDEFEVEKARVTKAADDAVDTIDTNAVIQQFEADKKEVSDAKDSAVAEINARPAELDGTLADVKNKIESRPAELDSAISAAATGIKAQSDSVDLSASNAKTQIDTDVSAVGNAKATAIDKINSQTDILSEANKFVVKGTNEIIGWSMLDQTAKDKILGVTPSAQIADGDVTTRKIANQAITIDKLQDNLIPKAVKSLGGKLSFKVVKGYLLDGYIVSTNKLGVTPNPNYAYIEIINLAAKGKIKLTDSTVNAGQLIVYKDNNGFYGTSYNTAQTILGVTRENGYMTIDLELQTRPTSLYIGYKMSDITDFDFVPIETTSLSDILPSVNLKNVISTINNVEVLVPPAYYVVDGDTCTINFDQMFLNKDLDLDNVSVTGNNHVANGVAQLTVTNDTDLEFKINGVSYVLPIKKIAKNAGEGKSVRVCVIGESTTEDGRFMTGLKTKFDNDVLDVAFVGSRISSNVAHEGRSGWTTRQLLSTESYNNKTNSFYNPSTKTFDYEYYLNTTGLDICDYYFINFGINDGSRSIPTSETINNINTIIDRIKIKAPNAKFIVGLSWSGSKHFNYRGSHSTWYRIKNTVKTINNYFAAKQSNGIYLAPMLLNVNSLWDMAFKEIDFNAYQTSIKSYVGTDNVHPGDAGYKKAADVCYWTLKKVVSS